MPKIFGWELTRVRKDLGALGVQVATNGQNPGPPTEQSLRQQGMDPSRPFSPGRPLNPYFGFSADPRAYDFRTGQNITARPRSNRVSFDTLRQITSAYDVARMCIARRIDSFRSFDWSIIPAEGAPGDVDDAIVLARRAIAKPDGRTPYASWIAMYLEDLFRYDAGTLYRRRNRAGKVIGLEVVDGATIAVLVDEYGRRPTAPAPAYIQYANGVPWDWLTEDDLVYLPFRPQPDDVYGLAPMETILLTANTDIRLAQHLLEYWAAGSIPGAIAEAPPEFTDPAQIEELQDAWDAKMQADQEKKVQVRWVMSGTKWTPIRTEHFDEKQALWLMRKTCAAYSVVPQDLGLTLDVNRANGETQMDIQERVADRPLGLHVDGIITAYLQEDLGLPVEFHTSLGAEKEDRVAEAEAWKIYIESGMASPDEGRSQILGLPIDNERPVPRYIMDHRTGPVPLTSLLSIAGPIDPETAAPADDPALQAAQFSGTPGTIADKLPGEAQFKKAPLNPDDPGHPENQQLRPETGIVGAPTLVSKALVHQRVRKDANKALVAAGLVVRAADTGRVLMLQRALDDDTDPAAGTWEFPGGHIEGEESAWQAAWREWQEETGCHLDSEVGVVAGSWTTGIYRGFVYEIPVEADLKINGQAGRILNPDDPDGDCIETAAWFEPAHIPDMPALRPECKTADWDLIAGLSPIAKSQTTGVTAATGMVGYNDGEDEEDLDGGRDGDNSLEAAATDLRDDVHDALEDERAAAVHKEMRRWRDNARGRVKDGRRPRRFESSILPADLAERVWKSLEQASTREEVDAAFSGRPFVRKAASSRPHLEHLEAAEAHYQPRLVTALALGLDPGALARGWTAIAPPVSKAAQRADDPLLKRANAYLRSLNIDSAELATVLEALYAEGYLIGAREALDLLRKAGRAPVTDELRDAAAALDWGRWVPGDARAAAELAGLDGGRGLQRLLDEAGVAIKSIVESRLGSLAQLLAEGARAGDPTDVIAREIADLLEEPGRADMIARTELARAVTESTFDTYRLNGIEQWDLLVWNPCDVCEEVEIDNPHNLGDDGPPFHPSCRCSAAPHLTEEDR